MNQVAFPYAPKPTLAIEEMRKIPPTIRFGTSSWVYPGWVRQVYVKHYRSEKEFSRDSLEEYASSGFFRTVGIDHSFYNPPKKELLERYANQTPDDFRWVSKVWERLTIPKYPPHPRYGKLAGTLNPDFLNPDEFSSAIASSYSSEIVKKKSGPFIFQFPPLQVSLIKELNFEERLNKFLSKLPDGFLYAVEIRNKELLTANYFKILNEYGVSHCFNHWHRMMNIKEQMKIAASAGGIKASFFIARLLTPLGISYEEAVQRFEPYNELKEPNEIMREDVVKLMQRAVNLSKSAYILVNNRCEGNAPSTIEAIINKYNSVNQVT